MKQLLKPVLRYSVLAALALAANNTHALNVYLRAGVTTNTMPGGMEIHMWGFSLESGPGVGLNRITSPGPSISVPIGDPALNIHVFNQLPEPVSIVVPGLAGTVGDVVRHLADNRVRSFTKEAAPGGSQTYSFANVAAGTYLYHSGSHPAVQVQMGLVGALTKLQAAGTAYTGAPTHTGEATLLFSEIDPALHAAVEGGTYGPSLAMSSTIRYAPQYYFINGVAYTPGMEFDTLKHIGFGVNYLVPSPGVNVRRKLVRMINATPSYRTPVIAGAHFMPYAEDGSPYPNGVNTPPQVARMMAPLKTMDVYWDLDRAGTFPVYDRQLGLANGLSSPGGMIGFLAIGREFPRTGAMSIPTGAPLSGIPINTGNAAAYGTAFSVSGLTGVVSKVTVRLNGLTHPRPQDLDIVLRSPSGQFVMFMSDLGGATAVAGVTLEFDEDATATIGSGPIVSGRYKPQNQVGNTDFMPPGTVLPLLPAGALPTSLSTFNGTNPNGNWGLYIRDNVAGPGATTGNLAGGYTLTITPRPE